MVINEAGTSDFINKQLNSIIMSRLQRLQNINGLIEILQSIAKNQCSLSEMDVHLLNEAIAKLNRLKIKKGLTNKHYQLEIVNIVELIFKFLTK
ncbi:hypothetical protein D0T56_06595 [Dysgonomonas sp. 520]|nr:hypothetical protein [Dysgonomonas sp. 520]